MGLGGQCHLDSMVARLIRDREVDLLTMKLGINVMGAASLSPRTFRGAVIGFTQIIREKHPTIPIGIISPIISPPREATPNAVGFTLEMMRDELIDVVDRIRQVTGDEKIYYFNGLALFGEELVDDYLPDDLHPNGDGLRDFGKQRYGEGSAATVDRPTVKAPQNFQPTITGQPSTMSGWRSA